MLIETETVALLTQPTITLEGSEAVSIPIAPEAQQLSLGKQLALLRETAKLSQRSLASMAGIDHSPISRLENDNNTRSPYISTVAVLAEVLQPDLPQTLNLIAALAKDEDRFYINDLLGLTDCSFNRPIIYGLKNDVSKASTPAEKAKDYIKRRRRSSRQIAEMGGINHTSVTRFLKRERAVFLGTSFISLVRGLGLITKEQVVDFFYSFVTQRKNSIVAQPAEQKAS